MIKELKPCPYCGGKAKLRDIGDRKEFYAYFCSQCEKTLANLHGEARLTIRGARHIWNRRAISDL